MKAKIFILTVFLLINIIGCKEDIIPVPPEVTAPVVAEAYASPSVILYNGSTTLFWESKNVTSVTINDIPVSNTTDSKSLKALTKDTIFNLKFIGENKQVVLKSVKITVGLPVVTGDAWATLTRIPYGSSTTINWESSKDVTSVTINGVLASTTTGSVELKALKKDTTFVFVFTGINGQVISKTVSVTVIIDPDKARTDSLCLNKYWKMESERYLQDGTWRTSTFGEEELSLKDYYYPSGRMESIRPSDSKLIGSGTWAWYGPNSIKWNDAEVTTYKFTDTTFISYERNGTIIMTFKSYPL